MTNRVMNEGIQHSVSTLDAITCLATVHSYLTNLVYIGFLLAQKRIQSWSDRFQKNGKYEVTNRVMNEEINNFSVLPGSHHLPSYYSFLFNKSNVYRISFGLKANSILVIGISEK